MKRHTLVFGLFAIALSVPPAGVAGDAGDTFNKALGSLLGGSDDPKKRKRNQNTNNSLTNMLFGHKVARSLDDSDRQIITNGLESLAVRKRHHWTNSDNGVRYRMVIDRNYTKDAKTCKEFTVTARIDGHWENAPGHGCRVAKGRWQVSGLSVPVHKTTIPDEEDEDL